MAEEVSYFCLVRTDFLSFLRHSARVNEHNHHVVVWAPVYFPQTPLLFPFLLLQMMEQKCPIFGYLPFRIMIKSLVEISQVALLLLVY